MSGLYSVYSNACDSAFGRTFTPKLQYNESADLLTDILQTFLQRTSNSLLDAFHLAVALADGASEAFTGEPAISEADADEFARIVRAFGVDTEEIEMFAADYEATLSSGTGRRSRFSRCPLIIAYSQGNLYANRALRLVDDPFCAAIVSIATPDDTVEGFAGPESYATLNEDLVIQGVRRVSGLPGPGPGPVLPSNLTNFPEFDLSLFGHHLAKGYLRSGSRSREEIENLIERIVRCGSFGICPSYEF